MYNLLTKKELSNCKIKNIKKDQVLFFEGDICKQVCIVKQGIIEIKSYTNSGKEILYSTINSGQMFGQNLIYSDDAHYKGNVIAKTDVSILYMSHSYFLKILKENDKFLIAYINNESEEVKTFNSKIKLLSFTSAEDRLMFYLKEHNNEIEYSSITSLSKELNIQRETLSRLVSKLSKKKIISNRNNKIKRL